MALKLSKKYDAYVYVNGHPEIVSKMDAHGLNLPLGWSVSKSRKILGVEVP